MGEKSTATLSHKQRQRRQAVRATAGFVGLADWDESTHAARARLLPPPAICNAGTPREFIVTRKEWPENCAEQPAAAGEVGKVCNARAAWAAQGADDRTERALRMLYGSLSELEGTNWWDHVRALDKLLHCLTQKRMATNFGLLALLRIATRDMADDWFVPQVNFFIRAHNTFDASSRDTEWRLYGHGNAWRFFADSCHGAKRAAQRFIANIMLFGDELHFVGIMYDTYAAELIILDTLTHHRSGRIGAVVVYWREFLRHLGIARPFRFWAPGLYRQEDAWRCGYLVVYSMIRTIRGCDSEPALEPHAKGWCRLRRACPRITPLTPSCRPTGLRPQDWARRLDPAVRPSYEEAIQHVYRDLGHMATNDLGLDDLAERPWVP
jgi:hypothetical protein